MLPHIEKMINDYRKAFPVDGMWLDVGVDLIGYIPEAGANTRYGKIYIQPAGERCHSERKNEEGVYQQLRKPTSAMKICWTFGNEDERVRLYGLLRNKHLFTKEADAQLVVCKMTGASLSYKMYYDAGNYDYSLRLLGDCLSELERDNCPTITAGQALTHISRTTNIVNNPYVLNANAFVYQFEEAPIALPLINLVFATYKIPLYEVWHV